MGENRILKRIGGKLRDETRDIVDERLPAPLRDLVRRLSAAPRQAGSGEGRRSAGG